MIQKSLKRNIGHTLCTLVSDEHINFMFLQGFKAEIYGPLTLNTKTCTTSHKIIQT